MRTIIACILSVGIAGLLLASGGANDTSTTQMESEAAIAPALAPAPEPAPTAASRGIAPPADGGGLAPSGVLQIADRKVISTAFVSVEVEAVAEAVVLVRTIAESRGGFVEQLSRSGAGERQSATLTIRVPQPAFFEALEQIGDLGTVEEEHVESQDVSEQFVDLEARLRAAEREEESLLKLLERANTVSEILTIERELGRVRSEIERLQGQLNFLSRRVDLATISVSLRPPGVRFVEPPSGQLALEVSNVTATVERTKNQVEALDGVVEHVLLSIDGDQESALLILRVPSARFGDALAFLEGQGNLVSKQTQEGGNDTTRPAADEPAARIDLSLAEEDGSDAGLIAAIVVPSVAVALALVGGLLALSRRRASR